MLDNSYWKIPKHTFEALKGYIENHRPPGDFLYAVLTNNLSVACGTADSQNRSKLCDIMGFLYNEIPAIAHGSPEKVETWLRRSEND